MSVQMPTLEQMRMIARQCGLSLDDADIESFRTLFRDHIEAYKLLASMPDELPTVKYPRTPGQRPPSQDNKHNAWYRKTSVRGAAKGKLAGRTIVLKDNIMLAGVPMMNGWPAPPISRHS